MSPSDHIQDDLLVLQCQQGDKPAFAQLVARWQAPLLRYAFRLLGDRDAALDAVQETWMAVIKGLVGLRDVARFRPWAYSILNKKCRGYWRKSGVRAAEVLVQEAAETGRTPLATDSSRQDELNRAFSRLSPDERTILALRYMEDFSVAEIGDVLGIPDGTVKSRLFHARRRLRELLER